MFQTEVVEKIKAYIFMFKNVYPKTSFFLWVNVEKFGLARRAAEDSKIRRRKDVIFMQDN